ncbi:MAG: trimethylamine methyltransferase family protein [Chloroflexota bacterium]|nr:trimethylamine methyltransferase family protein [Chloroflexota bacterium]
MFTMENTMSNNQREILSSSDIQSIHDTSMKLLANEGIRFPEDEAIDIFKKNGVKVNGQTVYLTEKQVMDAVEQVPSQFTIQARNPDKSIIVGDGEPVFAPGYGAPFVIDYEEGKRSPTMEDYHNLVKLAHALPNQDMSGHLLVEPGDVSSDTAHLEMLYASMVHSDKPFIGSTEGKEGALHTMEMAEILFGKKMEQPFTVGLINPLSPLGYGTDMIEATIAYARARQPLIIAALIMAGSTGPITLSGVVALQNAELLAGITLTQLVSPGTPAIYGSTSTNIDMRTGALALGGPECSLYIKVHAQLARHYGLPTRAGGALTDSSTVDAQSGYESMFSMLTTINSGIDFVLHAGGILGSYLAFSYEKFVMDDELCGMMRHYTKGIDVNPKTLAYDIIAKVGAGGHFLGEDHTLDRCRTEFWQPNLSDRSGIEAWWGGEQLDAAARARQRWQDLLAEHEDPRMDKTTRRQLQTYVAAQTE